MKLDLMRVSQIAALAALLPAAAVAQTAAPTPGTQKPASAAATASAPVSSTSVTGTWTGKVEQIGRGAPFAMTLTIGAGVATTDYPEQGCAGTLTRIGIGGAYNFYVEKITKGAYSAAKDTGCLDGTIVLVRAGDNLLLSWFGTLNRQPYQASATLSRAPPRL